MNPKEVLDRVVSLLESIGSTDRVELKLELTEIPEVEAIVGSIPDAIRSHTLELDPDHLEFVIRGICRIEAGGGRELLKEPHLGFGSTTVVPQLIKQIIDSDRADELIDWLFSNRASAYIPYGYQIPLGINSREEYRDYEERRAKHREEKLAADQEAHRAAATRKTEKARLHTERAILKRISRPEHP